MIFDNQINMYSLEKLALKLLSVLYEPILTSMVVLPMWNLDSATTDMHPLGNYMNVYTECLNISTAWLIMIGVWRVGDWGRE